jgi:hypothetical protein
MSVSFWPIADLPGGVVSGAMPPNNDLQVDAPKAVRV